MKPLLSEVSTTREYLNWLVRAPDGAVALYHNGLLMADRQRTKEGFMRRGSTLDHLADEVWRSHERGDVRLYQKRVDEGQCSYLALRVR